MNFDWTYPHLVSDDGINWSKAGEHRRIDAAKQFQALLADRDDRLARLSKFAMNNGVDLESGEGLDRFNELYVAAVWSDEVLWQSLRAIIWDTALWIGSRVIIANPSLNWQLHRGTRTAFGRNSPVLTGYLGVPNSGYYYSIFVILETQMWNWIGRTTGHLSAPNPPRDDTKEFSLVLRAASNGASSPFVSAFTKN